MFEKPIAEKVGEVYRIKKTGGIPGWLIAVGGLILLALIAK